MFIDHELFEEPALRQECHVYSHRTHRGFRTPLGVAGL